MIALEIPLECNVSGTWSHKLYLKNATLFRSELYVPSEFSSVTLYQEKHVYIFTGVNTSIGCESAHIIGDYDWLVFQTNKTGRSHFGKATTFNCVQWVYNESKFVLTGKLHTGNDSIDDLQIELPS